MAKDPLKPPVPDMLFHTTPGKPINPVHFEAIGHLSDAIFGGGPKVSEPKLSLKTHQKAIDAWKEATESWKKRCLLAEKSRDELYDAYRAWRETAADLAFGGRPYPEKGTPERNVLVDRFEKIHERMKAARQAGHPEEGPLA